MDSSLSVSLIFVERSETSESSVSMMASEHGYTLAVEKLLNIEVPRRRVKRYQKTCDLKGRTRF